MSATPWSLRRRLMMTVGAAMLITWCISGALIYFTAVQQSDQMLDDALDHTAHAVLAVIRDEAAELDEKGAEIGRELAEIDNTDQNDIVYQVLGPNGGMVFRSHGAPVAALAPLDDRGFRSTRIDGTDYRVFSLATELEAATIHVAQPLARRIVSARANVVQLLAPGGVLLLALMLAVAWSVRRTTAPVVRYAGSLDALSPDAETAADGSGLPLELQPVSRAIDRLLTRVRDALLRERTLTADAAHELRTPLAALRLQAQVARRSKHDTERNAMLEDLLAGADRTARLVDAILDLARYDASSRIQVSHRAVKLGRISRLVAAEFATPASERGIRIVVQSDESEVLGNEDALAIALRNLLSNALRYARKQIRIEVTGADKTVSIRVLDDGAGFDEESARRAFHRFFRGSWEGQTSHGAGLGLALVLRIAQLHGGSAQIVPGIEGGGGVAIQLPVVTFRERE